MSDGPVITSDAYREAGVDTQAASKAVEMIAALAGKTRRPEQADQVGGFAGLFEIGGGKLLAAATDGVGTKIEIARLTGRWETVGIDLVAMCADDVICTGAEPLFFLDYIAIGKVVPEKVAALVAGVAEGCAQAGCALLGGETAEHPGVMEPDAFDLAGFCVGSVEQAELLGPHRVAVGDALIGLPSSGLHSNGYSLVRKALLGRYSLDESPGGLGRTLTDELLEPTAIYAKRMLPAIRAGLIHSASHITGGGFHENIPRALPSTMGAELKRGSWVEQPIFALIQAEIGATDDDMFSTFNMGLGMVLAVSPDDTEAALGSLGDDAVVVGRVTDTPGVTLV